MTQLSQRLQQQLHYGIKTLGLSATPAQLAQYLQYLHLIHEWNQTHNLTAVRQLSDMVNRHIIDSLSIAPYITGQRILDLGSGAGLPGIPLAIYYSQKVFVLLDSQSKKVAFLRHAVYSLKLYNVTVVNQRAETYQTNTGFDHIVARAIGTLNQIIALSQRLCCPSGNILAMKGQLPTQELAAIDPTFDVTVHTLKIPLYDPVNACTSNTSHRKGSSTSPTRPKRHLIIMNPD